MALTPQVYNVPLNGGVDTKTDPKFVDAGHSLAATNALFQQMAATSVRYGTQTLPSVDENNNNITSGVNVASVNNDLSLLDGEKFYTYNPSRQHWTSHGKALSQNITAEKLIGGNASQTAPSMAVAQNVVFSAWVDSRGGVRYVVRDVADQNLYFQQDVMWLPTATSVQVLTDGMNIYIFPTVLSGGTYSLEYYVFNPLNPYNGPVLISTPANNISGANGAAKIAIDPNTYFLSFSSPPQKRFNIVFANSARTTLEYVQIAVTTGNPSQAVVPITSSSGTTVMPLGLDVVPMGVDYQGTSGQMAVLFVNNNGMQVVRGVVQQYLNTFSLPTTVLTANSAGLLGTILATNTPTQVAGPARFHIAYQQDPIVTNSGTGPGNPPASMGYATVTWPTIVMGDFNNLTGAFTQTGVLNGLRPMSNAVYYDGGVFMLARNPDCVQLNYGSGLEVTPASYQTTGYLIDFTGQVHSHFLQDVLSGNPPYTLFTLQNYGTDLWSCLSYDVQLARTQDGDITYSTALALYIFDGEDTTPDSVVPFDNLEGVNASELQLFDGGPLIEQGYYTYPELNVASFTQYTTGGNLGIVGAASIYTWYVVYQWVDFKGRMHYSAPSFPVTASSTGATFPAGNTNAMGMFIPYLPFSKRLARSMQVNAVLYRTRANDPGPSLTAYRVQTFPIPSGTNLAGQFYLDTASDASIEANEYLPFAANGEIEPDQAPPFYVAAEGQRRIFGIPQENRLTFWYSKQRVDGRAPEFSQAFTGEVEAEGGPLTAIGVMDDSVILFKANRIYKVLGSGPNALGSPSDGYSFPQLVSSTDGCVSPKSVLKTDYGLFFQGQRGIILLDRSLQLQYVGDPVYAFRNDVVTASFGVPAQDQVRFVTNNGVTLVFDYKQGKWSIYDYGGISGALWDTGTGLMDARTAVVLSEFGKARQEQTTLTTDDLRPINLTYRTPWLKTAQIAQGWGKLWEWSLLGTYLGPHELFVDIYYDYELTPSQTVKWEPGMVLNGDVYGSASPYGSDSPYGGSGSQTYQVRSRPAKAQCQAFSVQFRVVLANGASCQLNDLALTLGVANYTARLPVNKTV